MVPRCLTPLLPRSRVSAGEDMASPRPRSLPLAPGAARSPAPRVAGASPPANGAGSVGDEAIWKRLREAGFDEESVKRRDKAALIAYISKLESEVFFSLLLTLFSGTVGLFLKIFNNKLCFLILWLLFRFRFFLVVWIGAHC